MFCQCPYYVLFLSDDLITSAIQALHLLINLPTGQDKIRLLSNCVLTYSAQCGSIINPKGPMESWRTLFLNNYSDNSALANNIYKLCKHTFIIHANNKISSCYLLKFQRKKFGSINFSHCSNVGITSLSTVFL